MTDPHPETLTALVSHIRRMLAVAKEQRSEHVYLETSDVAALLCRIEQAEEALSQISRETRGVSDVALIRMGSIARSGLLP